MNPAIINATGDDRIRLWMLDGGKLRFQEHRNNSWIFVSGDRYDLDFLSRQLDQSGYGFFETSMANVYGPLTGLKIYCRPSRMPAIIDAINGIGMDRKFSIYNGDVDPVLRFMSEERFHFFDLVDPLDGDPDIPVAVISGKSRLGNPLTLSINGTEYPKINSDALYEVARAIQDNIMIVYNNTDSFFRKILYMIIDRGYTIPPVRTHGGSTYQSYGQIHYNNPRVSISGKICIETGSFAFSETGLEGLIEISRTSGLPITTASTVTTGTAVSSMEEYYAVSRGVLIPLRKNDHEGMKSAELLLSTDSGGMVLQPDPGIYADIHEIDFSSMYPSIIVNYNLSPETLDPRGSLSIHGTPYRISTGRKGFLSEALKALLDRRLFYKTVKDESDLYSRRDAALKWMLLTSFGYTGYKNAKFGKIEIHEAITAMGRWALARAIAISRKHGFSPVHGIVDSLWISGHGDTENLLREIETETRIGIVEDGHYRWIVFMPARSGLGALNRYIGLRYDGTVKVRGLQIRRSDSPPLCRFFQAQAIEILRQCQTPEHIWANRQKIKNLEKHYMKSLRKTRREDLEIGIHVTKHIEDYMVNNLQKKVLATAKAEGYDVSPGSRINGIVVDSRHGVIDLDGSLGGMDLSFYRRLLALSFEPIDFIVDSCAPPGKETDLFSFCL